jgi:hypothetical protein
MRRGDDIARWAKRVTEGDTVAIVSLFAIPVVALILLKTTRRELL